ncbi:MAG TPA: DUF3095 family protein [Thermohalobaculum sp.]|nr:DUF3095 family protein [Thermohalobaculum sp.]
MTDASAPAAAAPPPGSDWLAGVPLLDDFARAADPASYAPLPDDWVIGVADVVDSTEAIAAGRYKAVNLAGAGCISAVANALGGRLEVFVFGGDGAGFAVPPQAAAPAAEALARAAAWARRDLELELRVGMVPVRQVRAAGHDARVAFWKASDHVRYAMFSGGGVEWAEAELKRGALMLPPAPEGAEPDLTGLTCRWGPMRPARGKVMSLIAKPVPGAAPGRFEDVARRVIRELEGAACLNPVPVDGPPMHWPSAEKIGLHARLAARGRPRWRRRLSQAVSLALVWLVFRLDLTFGAFDAGRYRRELAANTDFRKFSDGLMMTVDCPPRVAARVRAILKRAARDGAAVYGLHLQDDALVTCFVPSALTPDHMHFIDGSGGGYAAAARQMRGARTGAAAG